MKKSALTISLVIILLQLSCTGQQAKHVPDMAKITNEEIWQIYNRNASYDKDVYVNANPGDGLVWLNDFEFSNGVIELDIKGKNNPGRSFVGVAFHGLDNEIYDAIYFRPFNFINPEKKDKSVQYIAHPEYPWHKLRKDHPGKYENEIFQEIQPDAWFHVTIVVKHPSVEVFVNNSEKPILVVEQLSDRKKGQIGLWVGNNADGNFKNLEITKH